MICNFLRTSLVRFTTSKSFIDGHKVVKVIVVPQRLVNVVIK
jgi:hypothetical protein